MEYCRILTNELLVELPFLINSKVLPDDIDFLTSTLILEQNLVIVFICEALVVILEKSLVLDTLDCKLFNVSLSGFIYVALDALDCKYGQ